MQWLPRAVFFFVTALVFCSAVLLLGQSVPTQNEKSSVPNSENEKPRGAGQNGVSLPVCTYMPSSPYTKEAISAKFEGNVLVEGVVGLDGKITNVRVLKSPGLGLDESVISTLRKWKCKPAKDRDGKPVPTIIAFQISFHLFERDTRDTTRTGPARKIPWF
jgi:TonB family protein